LYAIIESGGKQYRVAEGELIELERLQGEIGEKVNFDRVLLVGDGETAHLGTPWVERGQVVGTIADQGKLGKIIVFKFKRRKGYRRRRGHRQLVTTVRIEKIALGAKAKPQADSKPPAVTPSTTKKAETRTTTAELSKVAEKKTPKPAAKKKVRTKKTVKKKTAAATKSKSAASKKKTSKKTSTKVTKKSAKKKD